MDFSVFYDGIKKQKRIAWIGAVVIFGVGIGLGFIPIAEDDPGWVHVFKPLMVLFMLGTGAAVAKMAVQKPDDHKLLRALRHNPQDIVWGYVQRNFSNGAHVGSFVGIGLANGKAAVCPVPLGQEQGAIDLVAMAAPSATIGFSPELQKQFKNDPGSLR